MANVGFAKGCADLFARESRFIKAIGIDEKIAPIERYHAANAGTTNKFVCLAADTFVKLRAPPSSALDEIDDIDG